MKCCGHTWTIIKKTENSVYYIMNDYLPYMEFGYKNNNYRVSDIRKMLKKNKLAEELKQHFGNKLMPINTNLLSLDGLANYGVVKNDILAIPTLDLYRECRAKIPDVDVSWWLATPESTHKGCGPTDALYISFNQSIGSTATFHTKTVRPYFILQR